MRTQSLQNFRFRAAFCYNPFALQGIECSGNQKNSTGGTNMRNLFLCLVLACTASAWVMADDSADSKGKSDTRTITGCLSQGDNAKEFNLKAEDGSTWEVRSSNVALADHVGHTVKVTGVVSNAMAHNMKEDTKDMAHDTGATKENTEHGHLKVTHVKMVSDSCSK
jgi:hypothetical protein